MLPRSRNRGLLLVLAGALLLSGAVPFVANALSEDAPDSSDVALTVDGIDVTFAEIEVGRQLMLANEEVEERLRAGDRLGLPDAVYEVYLEVFTTTAEWRSEWSEDVRAIASLVSSTAVYAEAVRRGVAPTEDQIAMYVDLSISMEETYEPTGPIADYTTAWFEARRASFDEQEYRDQVLPQEARLSGAFENLLREMDLTPSDPVVMHLSTDLALDADVHVHPSLGVTTDEVEEYLRETRAQQQELTSQLERLGEAMDASGSGMLDAASEEATPEAH